MVGITRSKVHSLKRTWPLKMDGWNTSFLLGWPIFRGYVSFREGGNFFYFFEGVEAEWMGLRLEISNPQTGKICTGIFFSHFQLPQGGETKHTDEKREKRQALTEAMATL